MDDCTKKSVMVRCGIVLYVMLFIVALFNSNARCKVSMPNLVIPEGISDASRKQLCKVDLDHLSKFHSNVLIDRYMFWIISGFCIWLVSISDEG